MGLLLEKGGAPHYGVMNEGRKGAVMGTSSSRRKKKKSELLRFPLSGRRKGAAGIDTGGTETQANVLPGVLGVFI